MVLVGIISSTTSCGDASRSGQSASPINCTRKPSGNAVAHHRLQEFAHCVRSFVI